MSSIDSTIVIELARLGFFSDGPNDENDIEKFLEEKVVDSEAETEEDDDRVLVFNPETGELIIQQKEDERPSPDSVIATSIAKDGFFHN